MLGVNPHLFSFPLEGGGLRRGGICPNATVARGLVLRNDGKEKN